MKSVLTDEEYRKATAHTFPITIFERFFNMTRVREAWGFDFDGPNITFKNKAGFLVAFTEVIRGIVNPRAEVRLDTRNVSSDKIEELLERLPKVDSEVSDPYKVGEHEEQQSEAEAEPEPQPEPKPSHREQKGNIYRNRLILSFYQLDTSEARLSQLFYELKRLSVNSYVSVCAAAVRVFLDLAVLDFR